MTLRKGEWSLATIVDVPLGQCEPTDVVRALHEIADAVNAPLEGRASCGPGCGACCGQPVPITIPEIGFLQELVARMPEKRQQAIQDGIEETIARMPRFDLGPPAELGRKPKSELLKIALQWFQAEIPCPFLVDESCSIYKDRPLICREYLVSSPPTACLSPGSGAIERLRVPVSVWNLVARSATGRPSWMVLPEALRADPPAGPIQDGADLLAKYLGGRLAVESNTTSLDSPRVL